MASEIKWNNWRDRLRDASFRGVPFKVLSASTEGGRRSVLHQYPFSDVPYWEDMGGEAGTYQVQAYVVANFENGFDHFKERDALIAAFQESGPGTLVHPFLGTKQVGVMGKFKLDENAITEGGVARFTITFVDAGRAAQPTAAISDEGAIDEACSAADSALVVFDDTLLDKALAAAEIVEGVVNMANEVYASLLQIQSDVVGAISAAQTYVAEIRGTIANIIKFPDQLRTAIQNTLDTYSDLRLRVPTGNTSVVTAALKLTSAAGVTDAFPVTTPQREAQQEARYWATEAMMVGGLSQAVRIAVRVQYTSYDQVKAMLDKLVAAIDVVLDYIGSHSKNDKLTAATAALKPLVINNLVAKGADLPSVRTESLPADVQPALVLAQRLYGDIDRDQEIIDMNPVALRHPGFPKAGSDISVLSE